MSDTNTTLPSGVKPSDYFEMLDNIRESGVMNMFAAPRWMEENCDLSRADARAVFMAWTEQFGGAA